MSRTKQRPRFPYDCPTCGSYAPVKVIKGNRVRIRGHVGWGRKRGEPRKSLRVYYGVKRVYSGHGRTKNIGVCPDPFHHRDRSPVAHLFDGRPEVGKPKPAETEPSFKPSPSKEAAKKARNRERQSKAKR